MPGQNHISWSLSTPLSCLILCLLITIAHMPKPQTLPGSQSVLSSMTQQQVDPGCYLPGFVSPFSVSCPSFQQQREGAMGQAKSVQITRLLLIPHNCFCSFFLNSCYTSSLLQSLLFKVQHGQQKEPDRRFKVLLLHFLI